MKNLPIWIQSFEGLRSDGYIYVDKTEYVHDLGSRKGVYFLSRPRRFGKSLFLSDLEAAFKSKKNDLDGNSIDIRCRMEVITR
ncbi:MAG: AAA family ATPase [Tannerella sp.]|jgi:hypothetical protein|nr:AAA family ATPase [Tannerella sp.]